MAGAGETTSEEESDTLDDGAPVKSPAATNAIESEHTDESGQHVGDGVESRNPGDFFIGDTSCTEDRGGVNCDTSDTNPFLHNLEPDNELDTATGVELAGADTEQHSVVGLTAGSLALQFSDVADILELGLGFAHVLANFTAETSKDVAGFLL